MHCVPDQRACNVIATADINAFAPRDYAAEPPEPSAAELNLRGADRGVAAAGRRAVRRRRRRQGEPGAAEAAGSSSESGSEEEQR
jgi:hypothetical protein